MTAQVARNRSLGPIPLGERSGSPFYDTDSRIPPMATFTYSQASLERDYRILKRLRDEILSGRHPFYQPRPLRPDLQSNTNAASRESDRPIAGQRREGDVGASARLPVSPLPSRTSGQGDVDSQLRPSAVPSISGGPADNQSSKSYRDSETTSTYALRNSANDKLQPPQRLQRRQPSPLNATLSSSSIESSHSNTDVRFDPSRDKFAKQRLPPAANSAPLPGRADSFSQYRDRQRSPSPASSRRSRQDSPYNPRSVGPDNAMQMQRGRPDSNRYSSTTPNSAPSRYRSRSRSPQRNVYRSRSRSRSPLRSSLGYTRRRYSRSVSPARRNPPPRGHSFSFRRSPSPDMRYNSSRTGNTVHRASFPYRKPLDSNSHQRNDASRITARTFTPRESRAIEKASIERPGTGPQREFVPANRNLVASVFHPVPNHLNPIVPVHAVHRPVPEPVALNLPLPAELERRFGSPTSPAPFVTHVSLPHHSWSGPSTHPGMGSIKMEPKGEPISPWQDGPSYSVSQSSESPTGNGFAQWPGAVSSDAPTRRHVYGAEVTAAQHGAQHGRQAYRGRGTKHSTNGTRSVIAECWAS